MFQVSSTTGMLSTRVRVRAVPLTSCFATEVISVKTVYKDTFTAEAGPDREIVFLIYTQLAGVVVKEECTVVT